ncbi:HMG-box protein [Rhizoctonia solani AG-3 Rhs1AP]|uniref:HMG-box protein n=3 Tax=Rhizoctonia solani TaxID=456999 RepID=A0A074RVK2_9AGAM|nr:HMG-box protein [Rhizoctonia solani AG-3 Rhs1AP]KEP50954.1 HMG-box protein [Rhizoctonia solani 123E]
MFSNRILLMRPALYAHTSPQIRAFGLARIALEPARKTAPPPPPPLPPAKGRKTTATTKATDKIAAKASPPTATKKAAPVAAVAAAPATRARLTDKEREARDKLKEKERLAKAKEKEREKVRKAKEREKEKDKKEKEKLREAAKKEKEKVKAKAAKMMEKPYPPPPKAPRTGYLMFATDPAVKRDRGEGIVEDSTLASQAWKALSEAEREAYKKKSEQARAAWKEEIAKWVSSLNLAQLEAARANREPGTRDDSAMNTLPKRPGNRYALFLADMTSREDFRNKIDALVKKEGITDDRDVARKKISLYGRTSAEIWKSMSEKEKEAYATKATEAKEQWDKDFGHLIEAQKEEIAAALP